MEKSFTHCTIDVVSIVIFICNEKLLSPCPTKANMTKEVFLKHNMDKLRHSAIT